MFTRVGQVGNKNVYECRTVFPTYKDDSTFFSEQTSKFLPNYSFIFLVLAFPYPMAAYNGTTMAGQDFEAENNLTMATSTALADTWENATLYYSIPNPDPTLKDCKPAILQSEIEVSR